MMPSFHVYLSDSGKALSSKLIAQTLFWLATSTTMIGPSLPVCDCPLSYKTALALHRQEKASIRHTTYEHLFDMRLST